MTMQDGDLGYPLSMSPLPTQVGGNGNTVNFSFLCDLMIREKLLIIVLDSRVQRGSYGTVSVSQGSHSLQLEGEIGEDMGIEDSISKERR
jgi:hypothetical protein